MTPQSTAHTKVVPHIRASSEHLFHGNLGIQPRQVSLIALAVALVLTLALETVLAALHVGMPPDPLL